MSVGNLIDLADHSILATNDFRGNEIDTDDALYALVSAETSYHEANEITTLEDFDNNK